MYRISLYLFLLPYFFFQQRLLSHEPGRKGDMENADDTAGTDTCRKVTDYLYTHKVLEGMVCHDKREGIWREWYPDGRLKDSAMYKNGVRVYASSSIRQAKGMLIFRGDPKQFYKDSTYECRVKLNTYHGIRDIRGDYDGVSDTVYPPLFYFGADMAARDSFNYYFTPKVIGKYKLKLSLTGDAATSDGNGSFYEREVEVVRR